MSVYRLDPVPSRLADANWRASLVKEQLFVSAASPYEAREIAALRTLKRVHQPKHAIKLVSPWLSETLTRCVWEPAKNGVPLGTVLTAKGQSPQRAAAKAQMSNWDG